MTDEDIALEHETHLAFEGETLKTCPKCGTDTHRSHCPECSRKGKLFELTGDPEMDQARAKIEAGEEVDLDELLRGEKFEPVKRGED